MLLATGFFGVLSKPVLLAKSMRSVAQHPFFNQELSVTITLDALAVRSGPAAYNQPWSNFAGYRKAAVGYLFYFDKGSFFVIPQQALSAQDMASLDALLVHVGLQALP